MTANPVENGPLAGRAAVVTGAARGIGEAIARELVRRGAAVAITDRDGDLARSLAAALAFDGADCSLSKRTSRTRIAWQRSLRRSTRAGAASTSS